MSAVTGTTKFHPNIKSGHEVSLNSKIDLREMEGNLSPLQLKRRIQLQHSTSLGKPKTHALISLVAHASA